jgi:superfamily II DNA/RNA helicase
VCGPQIYEEGKMLCSFHALKLMCIYGGTNMKRDIDGFRYASSY